MRMWDFGVGGGDREQPKLQRRLSLCESGHLSNMTRAASASPARRRRGGKPSQGMGVTKAQRSVLELWGRNRKATCKEEEPENVAQGGPDCLDPQTNRGIKDLENGNLGESKETPETEVRVQPGSKSPGKHRVTGGTSQASGDLQFKADRAEDDT